jgi:endonuclease V-like protein UPF0215 family
MGALPTKTFTNVAGFDDAPFGRGAREVRIVGAVCARTRLDGVLSGRVARDGDDATEQIAELLLGSRFGRHLHAVLIQGIAVAGFNVVDIHALAARIERPVMALCRRPPDRDAVRAALLERVPNGARKWAIVEAAGPPEPLGALYAQRAGLTRDEALALLRATTLHGHLPEPLRLAHLIAGGVETGRSRGRA